MASNPVPIIIPCHRVVKSDGNLGGYSLCPKAIAPALSSDPSHLVEETDSPRDAKGLVGVGARGVYSEQEDAMARDLKALAEKHGIMLVLRFGSSVNQKTHARSDLDLAVLLDHPTVDFRRFADLLHDLQELFPGPEVDLAVLNHADPLFLKRITDDCEILYGPVQQLQRLKIYAFKRYQDHQKYFDIERRFASRFVASALPAE